MATIVRKKPGETDDKLVIKFRKQVQADGVLIDHRKKEYFVSDAEKRHERKKAFKRMRRRKS